MVGVAEVGMALDQVVLVLIALLGVGLFFVRPRTVPQLALAGFLTCYGLFLNLNRLEPGLSDARLLLYDLAYLLAIVAMACLVVLAVNFPRRLRRGGWRVLVAPFGLALAAGLVSGTAAAVATLEAGESHRGWDPPWLNALLTFTFTLGFCMYCGVTMALAARFRELERRGDDRSARAAAQVAMAFGPVALLITTLSARYAAEATDAVEAVYEASFAVLAVAMVAFWAWAAASVGPALSRTARNVVLVFAAFGAVNVVVELVFAPAYQLVLAAARLMALGVLSYAILRHQLFDLDIRLKWTLRRGSVAAVFLAVFFVVAQVAQNFLSTQFGWALGGVTAGLMLFAITPIQRAAERLSDKAMPNVKPDDPAYVLEKKRETYRNAYATAWADGTLTPKDMRMLQQVREALALPEKDVVRIERDWGRAAI